MTNKKQALTGIPRIIAITALMTFGVLAIMWGARQGNESERQPKQTTTTASFQARDIGDRPVIPCEFAGQQQVAIPCTGDDEYHVNLCYDQGRLCNSVDAAGRRWVNGRQAN